ncbi:hypothetical protein GCM10009555_064490 [Acrocarpospora macrocephala]|uniref:AbiJ-NTD3 domain-containing protein n=1 Tax=Acrocarpospora macrocephala TaxID=150177 RepID=A0A5M3WFW4_9ACTN|nr:hypothetical protein [Acrocarpospora macrocephala]GES07616.1 hypothetical protein Amac_012110 [Acrocarpospora macrocephala]
MLPGNPFLKGFSQTPNGTIFDSARVEQLRRGPLGDLADVDAALALARLTWDELVEYGTERKNLRLDNVEIAVALRALRAVLGHLRIVFDPPFRDQSGFHQYWKSRGMSDAGGWAKRRAYLTDLFEPVLAQLETIEDTQTGQQADRDGAAGQITEVTRRRLIDGLDAVRKKIMDEPAEGGAPVERPDLFWWGTLDEVAFLDRLYDLDRMPSLDPRYATARLDLIQHCINNDDFPADWIYRDERFGIGAHDGRLLRFLAETLHPVVRPEQVEVRHLHAFYSSVLAHDGYELVQVDQISGAPIFAGRRIGGGVSGTMKNIIFAADGPKPEIVLGDAVNNDIRIVCNAENCLVYDRPLKPEGLTWADLLSWWRDRQSLPTEVSDLDAGRDLCNRLWRSLASKPEQVLFHAYARAYLLREDTTRCPALIPQVYLHYDPQTRRQRGGKDSVLGRERMDFLLLLPHSTRVVLEVDGQQHYADGMEAGAVASPQLYSKMAAEDRALRLKGYEVYRFGGHELTRNEAAVTAMLQEFFEALLAKHPFTAP